jgi:hypothetical protein
MTHDIAVRQMVRTWDPEYGLILWKVKDYFFCVSDIPISFPKTNHWIWIKTCSSVFIGSILRWKQGQNLLPYSSNRRKSVSDQRFLSFTSNQLSLTSINFNLSAEKLGWRTEIWISLTVLQGDQGFCTKYNILDIGGITDHKKA